MTTVRSRQAWWLEQKLRAHILNYKHKAESELKKVCIFKLSKSASTDTPPKPLHTVPLTGNQAFKCWRQWGTSESTTGNDNSFHLVTVYKVTLTGGHLYLVKGP